MNLTQDHDKIITEERAMLPQEKDKDNFSWFRLWFSVGTVAVVTAVYLGTSFAAAANPRSFASAEEAVKAAVAAARANGEKELLAIFGADSKDLFVSGDPVDDKHRRERFLKAYDQKNKLVKEGDNTVLLVGKDEWPMPIPLVQKGKNWVFDVEQGREEILHRRIGENELSTIQVVLAIIDAQRDYWRMDIDGDGFREYAQEFRSNPGKKNGLYWEAKGDEEQSPLGPLVASARVEGYKAASAGARPTAYHGYYYKIITAQGKNASGGAYSYLVKGKMIGGFAVIAAPAQYGNSGVMTFIVNHDGVVYEKDLGKNTIELAKKMNRFDPDKSWKKVKKAAMP